MVDDDGQVRAACRRRAELSRAWRAAGLDPASRTERYLQMREQQRVVARLVRQRQRAFERTMYHRIEESRADATTFYKRVRALAGRGRRRQLPTAMQMPGGGMTATAAEVDCAWTNHYQSVSSVREDDDSFDVHHFYDVKRAVREAATSDKSEHVGAGAVGSGDDLNSDITLAEVTTAVKTARAGRAAGPDGISINMVKRGGAVMVRALHVLMTALWRAERVPNAWLLAQLVPVYKGSGALGPWQLPSNRSHGGHREAV